jgi:hypothetical protein
MMDTDDREVAVFEAMAAITTSRFAISELILALNRINDPEAVRAACSARASIAFIDRRLAATARLLGKTEASEA